jgi:hypothetical protein
LTARPIAEKYARQAAHSRRIGMMSRAAELQRLADRWTKVAEEEEANPPRPLTVTNDVTIPESYIRRFGTGGE